MKGKKLHLSSREAVARQLNKRAKLLVNNDRQHKSSIFSRIAGLCFLPSIREGRKSKLNPIDPVNPVRRFALQLNHYNVQLYSQLHTISRA
jgi:hypothetical protein